MKKIKAPLDNLTIESLAVGDEVQLSGIVFTMRDRTHILIYDLLKKRGALPFELEGAVIFYAGPSPSKTGTGVGVIGPTTGKRMDIFTPTLLKAGVKGMIGKGPRGKKVVEAIKENKAVYFAAPGGVAAYLAQFVKEAEVVAFPELGPEAVYRLVLEDLPLVVAIDYKGQSIFSSWQSNLPEMEEL